MLKNIWKDSVGKINKTKVSKISEIGAPPETIAVYVGEYGYANLDDLITQYCWLRKFYEKNRSLTSKERAERRKETMQRYYARHRDEIRARQQSYYQERKKASTVKK